MTHGLEMFVIGLIKNIVKILNLNITCKISTLLIPTFIQPDPVCRFTRHLVNKVGFG